MKAVVLETRDREAAVLVNDGTVRIVRGAYNVGDIIDYRNEPSLVQWIAAVVAMVVLVGGSAGLWIDRNFVTYAEVSLDVNPSIVYSLNKRDRVLNVRAVNDDAASIVAELEQDGIRFMPLYEAVERTMVVLDNQGYLDEATDDYVLLNVSADDGERQNRLSEDVEAAMAETMGQNPTMEYRIDHSDGKTARKARDEGMSIGRYSVWQQAGEGSDKRDYLDKPVHELMGQNPADDQPDPKGMPDSTPGDGLQTPPSDEEKAQAPSIPIQGEEDAEGPSGSSAPAEKPSSDSPSNNTQLPVEGPTGEAQAPAQGPTNDAPNGEKEQPEAADTIPAQDPAEPDKEPGAQPDARPASAEKGESTPKQDPSSDQDKTFSQPNSGSGQPEQPKADTKQAFPRDSGRNPPGDKAPAPKR